jgi:7,8-dihydropterin-6-yl-methyl-4-(beta-D-ribofuranosyl)aminobenzene 5'-phosphate synthase
MELKVLVDNNTLIDRYFYGEPGVSYFLQDGKTKILFDVGYSDIFIKNARKMNVGLDDIDYVVISHGHNDHTGGLFPYSELQATAQLYNEYHRKPTIVSHPEAFLYKEQDTEEIGSVLSLEELDKNFCLSLSKEPVWLTDKIVFLGEIKRQNNFENREPIGKFKKNGKLFEDFVIDDSALVYKSLSGLVIVTGCSHAGICNIIEYAKTVCDEKRIVGVIGGFHLLNPPKEQVDGTLTYFKNIKVETMYPCHCTGLKFKIELSKIANIEEVGVGLTLQYDE